MGGIRSETGRIVGVTLVRDERRYSLDHVRGGYGGVLTGLRVRVRVGVAAKCVVEGGRIDPKAALVDVSDLGVAPINRIPGLISAEYSFQTARGRKPQAQACLAKLESRLNVGIAVHDDGGRIGGDHAVLEHTVQHI